jgi:hypothetical protein
MMRTVGTGPVDEYDCIRDPLISHLLRGATRYQIAEFLRDELSGHSAWSRGS